MQKKMFAVLFFCLFFATICFGAIPGVYLGGGGGYGILKTPNKLLFNVSGTNVSNKKERGGLSGRVFLGYNPTRWFGLEGGFGRYARSRYSASIDAASSSIRYYAYEADGVLKLYLPFGCSGLNLYALGGAGVYIGQDKFANAGIPLVDNYTPPDIPHTNVKRTRPIYGGGIDFDFGCKFSINAEFTRIQALGSFAHNKAPVPYSDLYTLNLAYHFS